MPKTLVQIADDGTMTIQVTDWLTPMVAANLVGATIVGKTEVSGSEITTYIVATPKVPFQPNKVAAVVAPPAPPVVPAKPVAVTK